MALPTPVPFLEARNGIQYLLFFQRCSYASFSALLSSLKYISRICLHCRKMPFRQSHLEKIPCSSGKGNFFQGFLSLFSPLKREKNGSHRTWIFVRFLPLLLRLPLFPGKVISWTNPKGRNISPAARQREKNFKLLPFPTQVCFYFFFFFFS